MPKARKKKKAQVDWDQIQRCQNCGHENTGKYCANCGQSYMESKRPIKELLHDLVGVFSLDSSIFRTIGPFLFKPGYLSREYLDGRRKTFMSPVRLYLFMSIVFFFVASKFATDSVVDGPRTFEAQTDSTETTVLTDKELVEVLRNDSNFVVIGQDTVYADTARSALEEKIEQKSADAIENPVLYVSDFFKNISYSLFILMPIFAFLLYLVNIRRKHYYVEHLIFTLNFHSFSLLILTLLAIMVAIIKGNDDFMVLIILIIPVYFLAGMKRFYQQNFWMLLLKSLIVWMIYLLLIFATLIGLVFLTMMRL